MLGTDDVDLGDFLNSTEPLSRSDSTLPVLERKGSASGKLPRGWQERLRDDGITEYYNQKTGVVQTERPYDQCGTFGCILEDRHRGPHQCPEVGGAGRSRRRDASGGGAAAEVAAIERANRHAAPIGRPAKAPKAEHDRGTEQGRKSGTAPAPAREQVPAKVPDMEIEKIMRVEKREGHWRCAPVSACRAVVSAPSCHPTAPPHTPHPAHPVTRSCPPRHLHAFGYPERRNPHPAPHPV